MKEITNFIFDYKKEEKWLSYMAKHGYLLVDRKFGTYYFVESDDEWEISVVKFASPVNTGESDEEIEEIEQNGQTYVCGYRCFGYFRGKERVDTTARKEVTSHYFNIALLCLLFFAFSLGVLAYQITFFVFQKSLESGFYALPITVVSVFFVLTLALAVLSSYYLALSTKYYLKRKRKEKIDV